MRYQTTHLNSPRAAPYLPGRMLILIRWLAVFGQFTTLMVVALGLGYPVDLPTTLVVVALSAMVNLWLRLTGRGNEPQSERSACAYFAFDILQLSALLYLTGGLQNPFALLIVAPVTVAATTLSRRSVLLLCGLAMLSVTLLAKWHEPIPLPEGFLELSPIYVAGLWAAILVGLSVNAAYSWWMAEEARRVERALDATRDALAREQRLAAVGGLAASTAHELGSPLGTIAVVARELSRQGPDSEDWKEDLQLLMEQTARCRDILADLSIRSDTDPNAPFQTIAIPLLVEEAVEAFTTNNIPVLIEVSSADTIEVRRSPELLRGLGAIIQNATQFARTQVRVEILGENEGQLRLRIEDDGPGINPSVLSRMGEPYISSRRGTDGHMGLGVFIATTLLHACGGDLTFSNNPKGGARVDVSIPAIGQGSD